MFRCTGKHFRCELSDWTDRRRPLLWNICGKCWVLLAADYYVKGMVKKSGSRYMRQCEATVVCRDANNAVHTIHDTDFNTSSNVVLMLCCPLFFPFFPFFPHKDLNWIQSFFGTGCYNLLFQTIIISWLCVFLISSLLSQNQPLVIRMRQVHWLKQCDTVVCTTAYCFVIKETILHDTKIFITTSKVSFKVYLKLWKELEL